MNFDELCADFSRRKPTVEVGEVPFIMIEWKGKYVSSNDLLRTYLNSNKIPWHIFRRCIFENDRGKAAEKR